MQRTLLLTSAGMRMQTEILKLLPKSPAETKLAHIITASNEVRPHPWRDDDKKNGRCGKNQKEIGMDWLITSRRWGLSLF